ncbi:MAG: FxsA family protein [Pseudomonadota bacterium]
MVLFLTIALPLLEIAGFIVIGGKIGVGMSLLWVIGSAVGGFSLLAAMGGQTLQKVRKSVDADIYPFEEMFDGICMMIGALLLIFPGFISDFLAVPLLITPVRHGIFSFLKVRYKGILDNFSRNAKGAASWYYHEERGGVASKTIEGDFMRVEDRNGNDE